MNIKNQKEWLEFSKSSWDAAGRPKGLDPLDILNNPINYDHYYYSYFEQKYIYKWYSIYANVAPVTGLYIKKENPFYKEAWGRNFNWPTIWKQTLPLLVYGTTLGADNDVLVKLASWYSIGQAIPSMVVDRILDSDTDIEMYNSDIAFSILSYIKALKGLRNMRLPSSSKLEDVYLDLTSEMYERMFTEHCNRFKLYPEYISDAIRIYLSPNSRLLSSVFFSILPIWAYLLTDEKSNLKKTDERLTNKIKESFEKLRMVRQLNDEILDVKHDLENGLLTLPWLYAIEEKKELKEVIEILWDKRKGSTSIEECYQILESTSGRERSMEQSLDFLSYSMSNTMENFNVEKAFDVTLLHNIRWALLKWLEQVHFKRNPQHIYDPVIPQNKILDTSSSVEPIPGGGVIVYNSSGYVLLTLVMKRGMLRWEIPAGMSKSAESIEETAKREVWEETGKDIEIEIGDTIATCWHYSCMINKGWMGLFFRGNIKNEKEQGIDKITLIKPEAFRNNKFNMHSNPELYQSVNLKDCDFDELLRLCDYYSHSTVHEIAIASGFVDWKKIPVGRLHPLHRELLETLETNENPIVFLYANADEDFNKYDKKSRLYFNN
jgi:8-oxo-dGTP pyrophosphatase MutT (NUDIX family)